MKSVSCIKRKIYPIIALLTLCVFYNSAYALTKTSVATGNWSAPGTWSPSGVPGNGDDVVIHGGNVVTVNGAYTCNNLYVGDATSGVTTLTVTVGNSLTINGDLKINPNNVANTYTFDAGAGSINVAGTFSYWSTTGTNNIKAAAGTLSFTPAVAITNANQNVTFTGAGTINFNNTFTDSYNKLVTFAGCTVNFYKSYTVNTTVASWAGKGTAKFRGNGYSITPTSNLTLFNVQFDSSTTLASAAGTVIVGGDLTISSGATFTANKDFEVDGNWTNNGGTLSGGSNTISFNGNTKTFGGTSRTVFPNVQIGASAATVAYTMNVNCTFNNLTFHSSTLARTLTITTGDTLTVNGNLTINQPGAAVNNQLAVNGAVCNVAGNLIFSGISNTATFVSSVAVTTGTFSVAGSVTWMSNTAVATEVISATTGTLTFSSPLTMGSGSGTLSVTGAGTINFNGNTSTSFNFGGATAPVFTTAAACNLYFAKGFTNNSNALVFNATSNTYFTGNGSITPNAAITFGNIQLNASAKDTLAAGSATVIAGNVTLSAGSTLTANQNFEVDGSWTNNGGTLSAGSYTISFNGNTKTFSGTSSTTFPNVQIGVTAATVAYTMNTNNTFNNLTFSSSTLARTLTITTGDTLTISGNLTINQPGAAVNNQLAVNGAVCNVAGNLVFSGINNTATFVSSVAVTTGSFTVNGTVTWMSNAAVATEVISVTTGNLTFGSSVAMGSGSGTISATGAATVKFNGTSAPSFSFGGATAPVFTTSAGTNIYFAAGFTNSTNALVLNATSNAYFTGNGTINPSAAITFGNIQLNAGAVDTLASGSTIIIAGNLTLSASSSLKANQSFEVDGNWTNNGGTLSAGSNTVYLNGNAKTIGGTTATAFPNLQMGNGATAVSYTMNINNTCNNLIFQSAATARTLTLSVGDTLAVSGNLTLNQATAAVTNQLAVNAGVCTVAGNLIFSGVTNTATFICKVGVTTGSFTVNGTVTWMSNTLVATEVITATTGTIAFGSSLTMGSGSGTLSVTSTGTIRFNGTTAPSFNFGGAATVPVFTTTAGCNLYFAKGFTNNTNALVLNATSNSYFTGSGTITPSAAITFGNVQFNASVNDTLATGGAVIIAGDVTISAGATFKALQNFEFDGNWTNNGGTLDGGSNTVIINGLTKTIGGTSSTAFPNLQIGNTAVVLNYTVNKNISCNDLTFNGNTTARTFTLSPGVVFSVAGNFTMNQPTAAVTSTLAVNAGSCTVTGNMTFVGVTNTATFIDRVAVTSGSFTLNGTLTWMSNTLSATEVITTATGTLTFGNSITMGSGSGTISVTSTGTINFNGSSAPSLNFGGATAPVLTTTSGSTTNFAKGLTAATTALTFAVGSTQVFQGTATITPTAAITFGNFQINPTYTVTLAGSITVKGNWNDRGSFVASTNTVTINGGVTEAMNGNGGETFYNLTIATAATVFQLLDNVTVTNNLTMTAGKIDLNNYTLTLGNNAGAALVYTAGQAYGGTFKRWFPVGAISSAAGNKYGLFPIGTRLDYRPVTINSTVNPTTAGYVSVTHTNTAGVTAVTYTDNGGTAIQQIANMHSDISTSGLAGGTYNLDVQYADLGSTGALTDLKLETYTSSVMGSCGTHAATTGTLAIPVGHRTALTLANLNNAWVIATKNSSNTPFYLYVYSRKSGNWNDVTAGNGTWSYTPGGSGASCNCIPTGSGYATIESGHTVTLTASDSAKFLDIKNSAALTINATRTLNVGNNMTMFGTGTFTNNGIVVVQNELKMSSAVSPSVNGNVTAVGTFTLPSGTAYTQSSGTLTVNGDMALSGSLSMASGATLVFDGNGARLSGSGGTYTTAAGGTFPITNNKSINSGTSITIGSGATNTAVAIAASTTVTNGGTIIVNGDITGAASTSVWMNDVSSSLSLTGALLATGVLDVATAPNTVEYNGSGAQTIILPLSSYYDLKASTSGTKTLPGNIIVDHMLTVSGSTIVDESTNSISGSGGLTMSGTSELKLSRSNHASSYPELAGAYSCTGGTVTVNQTTDSCLIHSAQYYNLKLNGAAPYDLSGVSSITNNLDIQGTANLNNNTALTVGGTFTYASSASTTLNDSIAVNGIVLSAGTLNDGGRSINVTGAGGWTLNSGATFTSNNGSLYFTGSSAQTLGGTSANQTFNNLIINKSSNTVTAGGSLTTLNLNNDMTLASGTFDKGTAATIYTLGDWNFNGGTFVPGNGTVIFSDTTDSAIKGSAGTASFNNLTVNMGPAKVGIGGNIRTLSLAGNLTLTSGGVDAGTATAINMTGGNWTNNGGTFTPASSTVTFSSAGAQAINGTATAQNFQNITINKSANTLSIADSTTTLTLNGNMSITSGTFNYGTAPTIYVGGNWSMTGGSFTSSGSTVIMNGSATQNMTSTGAFSGLQINNPTAYVNLTGNITVNDTLTFAAGLIQTNAYKVALASSAATLGAGSGKYIYGNEQISIPNAAAPSRTFDIGDASTYAPVIIDFVGTTSGSGSVTAFTTAGDDAGIANSGINSTKSVNRTWTLANNGVTGFTSYSPTYTFAASDVDAGANTANFEVRRVIGSAWDTTIAGARTATSTQCTAETAWGRAQIGEKNTLTVATQPGNTNACTGFSTTITSTSTSIPTPSVKWQRDDNTGVFVDITGGMDGSIYSSFTTSTLNISNPNALNNYKYRAVFTNINGQVVSDPDTLILNTTPTISGTTPGSRCDAGTVLLGATASAGTVNWYSAASGGSALTTGTGFTTPSIPTTTTYYADATANGCTTATRTSVVATVYTTPSVTTTAVGAVCDSGTVALGATASAGSINWYAAASGGSSLHAGTSYTTPAISSTTNYYVDATANGCTTTSRTAVTATVSVTPTATIAYQSCAGVDGNTTIRISQTNGTSPFTYKLNSGSFTTVDTFHIANGSNQNYYVKDTFGCTSVATNYTATSAVPSQIAATGASTTCNCVSAAEGRDVYLTNSSGDLIAIINDRGHNLGTITATVYTRANPVLIANNQGGNDAAMSRSFVLDFTGTNLTPNVEVKFPFTNSELNDLIVASAATPILSDDVTSITGVGSTQYEGPGEDDTYNTSAATMLLYHRQIGSGSILNGKYVKIGLSANGEHWLHGNTNGASLPIKLVSFDATANQTMERVETRWTTMLEVNNAYFTIERSEDGVNFNEVARVNGAGNYTGTLDYRFDDVKPFYGLSYYRLKQTDFDGAFSYSDIVAVTMGTQSSFQLYPNPTENETTIDISNPSEEVKLTIYDMSGHEVFGRTYNNEGHSKNQIITLQAKYLLPAGMYMVNVATNGTQFMKKLVLN